MLALDLLANGLIYGCFYALMAVGLAMIFGVLKIVNFAHGEFFMIGAYTYVLVGLKLGVSPWLALPGAALAGALLGWVVERLLMRPLYAGYASWGFMKDEYAVVVTFGLSLLLINLVDKIVGPYSFRGPPLVDIGRFALGPVMLTGQKAIAALRRRRAHGRPRALHQAIGVGPADPGGRAEPARRLARRHRRDAHHQPDLRHLGRARGARRARCSRRSSTRRPTSARFRRSSRT